jgi:hypothetical protein
MSQNPWKPDREASLRELYPTLSDAELKEADENLRQYVALAWRVFERLERDPEAWARFEALTASRRELTMKGKGSVNPSSPA